MNLCPTCHAPVMSASVLVRGLTHRTPATLDVKQLPLGDGLVMLIGHERGQTLGLLLSEPRPHGVLGRVLAAASHAHRLHVCDRAPLPIKAAS